MPKEKHSIFRQQALERLSSPEQLDRLMPVVTQKDWLLLGSLAVFGFLGLLWSVFGSIPVTVTGKGMLIDPRKVVPFQSPISGQLQSFNVEPGDCVKKDELLATIDPSDKKQQLQQQQEKLAQLKQQIAQATLLRQQHTLIETAEISSERASLKQRLQNTQNLTPRLQRAGLNSIAQQRRSLEQDLLDAQELTPVLQQRVTKQRELQAEGAISAERVFQSEQEYRQSRQKISEIQAQLQQLRVQEAELQQQYLENLNSTTQIRADLEKLALRNKQLEQDNLEATNNEKNQIQELEQAIARFAKEVADNSYIKSPHAGCILETTATAGQYVNPGTRLGNLQTDEKPNQMMSVAYFKVEDGKKIQPGMPILVTPDTVQRTRFGGIVGKIVDVSSFPVTSEGANSVLGSPEVVKKLMAEGGGKIEAIAQLKHDSETFSGYQWSSSREPELEVSSGTTTTVKVTVEERSPITWVMPILREWTGI